MRGNCVIVTAEPQGTFDEGFVAAGQTFQPGMIVQRDPTVALKAGRHTYKLFARTADGDRPAGSFWVVTGRLQTMLGFPITNSIAAGSRTELYSPVAGEELNLMVANLAGTGDDHALGEIEIVQNNTGKLVVTAGTPQTEIAQLLEVITDPTADTLAWCQWSGH